MSGTWAAAALIFTLLLFSFSPSAGGSPRGRAGSPLFGVGGKREREEALLTQSAATAGPLVFGF